MVGAQHRSRPGVNPVATRLLAIDHLRGMIMILMALDHTRDYFSSAHFNPLDLDLTSNALFFTRWITHFCAPLFIFLSGVSTALSLAKNQDTRTQAKLLLIRGLWLIILELTWIRVLGWDFGFSQSSIGAGVIWAIGWSMITLSGLMVLPKSWILLFSLALIIGHNALDGIQPSQFGTMAWMWQVLHTGGSIALWGSQTFHPYYPLIPWIGVMSLGYVMGPVFQQAAASRQKTLTGLGIVLSLAFIMLRWQQGYGDSHAWVNHGSWTRQLLAFLDCSKYPPSLHYLLMTLGPGFICLALTERFMRERQPLIATLGEVPLIFYLLHLPLIPGLAVVWDLSVYGTAIWQIEWPFNADHLQPPPDHGIALPGVYLVTLCVVAILYPVCRRYGQIRKQGRYPLLRYL